MTLKVPLSNCVPNIRQGLSDSLREDPIKTDSTRPSLTKESKGGRPKPKIWIESSETMAIEEIERRPKTQKFLSSFLKQLDEQSSNCENSLNQDSFLQKFEPLEQNSSFLRSSLTSFGQSEIRIFAQPGRDLSADFENWIKKDFTALSAKRNSIHATKYAGGDRFALPSIADDVPIVSEPLDRVKQFKAFEFKVKK